MGSSEPGNTVDISINSLYLDFTAFYQNAVSQLLVEPWSPATYHVESKSHVDHDSGSRWAHSQCMGPIEHQLLHIWISQLSMKMALPQPLVEFWIRTNHHIQPNFYVDPDSSS